MRNTVSILVVLVVAQIAVACGAVDKLTGKSKKSSGGSVGAASSGAPDPDDAMAVTTAAQLPPCDAAHDGYLIYVTTPQQFETCSSGAWSVINLQGPTGPVGAGSTDAENAKGYALYTKYKDAVFRVETQCTPVSPFPADCPTDPSTGQADNPTVFLGSAFLCDTNTICTNQHVAMCNEPSGCFTFKSMTVQALSGTTDTVNSNGTPTTPFFTVSATTTFKPHPTKDLVKIPVTGVPSTAVVIPITPTAAAGNVKAITTTTLSMSFPLGFQDLYTDVGHVDTPFIGECDTQGGLSGYGCPSADYDFSTSNETDHGSSGSPLIDVDAGVVIGVTTAGTDGANVDFTWAIDAHHLSEIH